MNELTHPHWLLTSSPWKRVSATAAAVVVAASGLGYGINKAVTGSGNPPVGTANIWIESGSGACAGGRSATPVTYEDSASPDRRCGTFDAAWDAMNAGDTARVKDGSYAGQTISGDKASTTKIIGGSRSGVVLSGVISCEAVFGGDAILCPEGDNLWLENVTVDLGSTTNEVNGNVYVAAAYSPVTLKSVDLRGDHAAIGIYANNFTWDDGNLGDPGEAVVRQTCSQPSIEPIWVHAGNNVTINRIIFHPRNVQDTPTPNQGSCGDDGLPHLEAIRIEGAITGFTISNSHFHGAPDGAEYGSGYIFGNNSGATGMKIIGNHFENNGAGTWMQWNGGGPSDITLAYNTWAEDSDDGVNGGGYSVVVGNLAPSNRGGSCTIHFKNVWAGSGSCGTDTFTGGAASALGIGTDGKLEAGSPAIDAAETPGASDYCTDASYVNSLDFENTIRPQGSICDAGWDER